MAKNKKSKPYNWSGSGSIRGGVPRKVGKKSSGRKR